MSFFAIEIMKFGIKQYQIGIFFFAFSVSYSIFSFVYTISLKNPPRRIIFVISFAVIGLSMGLMGPSKILMLPNNVYIILIGFITQGIVDPLLYIYAYPEAIDRFYHQYDLIEGQNKEFDAIISDKFGSLYTFVTSISCLVSPFIGSAVFEVYKYKTTMDINMLVMFGFSLIYLIFNCGLDFRCEHRTFCKERRERK